MSKVPRRHRLHQMLGRREGNLPRACSCSNSSLDHDSQSSRIHSSSAVSTAILSSLLLPSPAAAAILEDATRRRRGGAAAAARCVKRHGALGVVDGCTDAPQWTLRAVAACRPADAVAAVAAVVAVAELGPIAAPFADGYAMRPANGERPSARVVWRSRGSQPPSGDRCAGRRRRMDRTIFRRSGVARGEHGFRVHILAAEADAYPPAHAHTDAAPAADT
jgi:hypothetical protein